MQLSNSPLGEFSKASTLQRLIQLAYSYSIPGLPPEGNTTAESYALYVQTAGFGRSEIETCARLRLTLLKVPSLLSLLWGETRNTRLLSSIFHVTGWGAAICLHAGVKHCSRCLCGGFAFAESEAKCLFWILNTEKQARAFFPRALATAHLDCSVQETSDGTRQQLVRFGLAKRFAVVLLFSFFCKHGLTVKWHHAAFTHWVLRLVVVPALVAG